MKDFKSIIILLISLFFINQITNAQCTPDPNCVDVDGDGEFCPTQFPYAVEDEYYDQTLTVIAPIEQQGVQLHHIDILSIDNIPPGMQYEYQDDDFSFYPAVPKCVSVYGTPEIGSWGTYTLYISIEIFMDVAGFPVSLGVIEDSSAWVLIQPQLHSDFDIYLEDDNIMCLENTYDLSYSGNATADGTYHWDFGENIEVISGEGQGPYVLQALDYTDLDSITLYIEEGPYTSPISSREYMITTCMSVDDGPLNSLSIQPNPFKNQLVISGLGNRYSQIEIYDLMGRLVKSYASQENQMQLDLFNLQKGIYLLSVINGHESITQKIVKR